MHQWCQTVKQPKLDELYVKLVYKPMLELFDLLRARQSRVFVCSGGGQDFMRAFAEETWGIYKENVIGTAAAYTYAAGKIVRAAEVLGGLDIGRASRSTSSRRPAGCPRSRAATPTSTSRCLRRPGSRCSSTTATRSASSPMAGGRACYPQPDIVQGAVVGAHPDKSAAGTGRNGLGNPVSLASDLSRRTSAERVRGVGA